MGNKRRYNERTGEHFGIKIIKLKKPYNIVENENRELNNITHERLIYKMLLVK